MKTKKKLTPVVIFVTIFIISAFFRPDSFIQQNSTSLFLCTRDYFAECFRNPLPLSNIIASFLLQFYDIPFVGPLILASVVTLIFLFLRSFAARIGISSDIPAAAIASTIWFFSADKLTVGTVTLLSSALLFIASVTILPQKGTAARITAIGMFSPIIAAVLILFVPSRKDYETLSKLDNAIWKHQWQKVLSVANPDACSKNPSLKAYAAFALAGEGTLEKQMKRYSITTSSELTMDDIASAEAYYFTALRYEAMGCPAQSMHLTFQTSTHLKHGMNFRTIKQMIRYSIDEGKYSLARKFAFILSQSPRYHKAAKTILKKYASTEDSSKRMESPVITHDALYNAYVISQSKYSTNFSIQYANAGSVVE